MPLLCVRVLMAASVACSFDSPSYNELLISPRLVAALVAHAGKRLGDDELLQARCKVCPVRRHVSCLERVALQVVHPHLVCHAGPQSLDITAVRNHALPPPRADCVPRCLSTSMSLQLSTVSHPREEEVLVLGLDLSPQLRHDADAVQARRRWRAGQLRQSREHVPEGPGEVRRAAWLYGGGPPRHGWRAYPTFEHAPLVPREPSRRVEEEVAVATLQMRSIIGREEDESVVVDAQTRQSAQKIADLSIKVRDDGSVILFHVRPWFVGVLQIRGYGGSVLWRLRRISPPTCVRDRVAQVQEERTCPLRHRLQPCHAILVEDVDCVVVELRVAHAKGPAPLPAVALQLEVQLLHAGIDVRRVHVVTEGLIDLAGEGLEALLLR
mmetsp:Transcript_8713/g.17224  ORF Transcript_8713/g.17224 Transcript_8713/m.17224 type:complete len:382 (+) Transcript_8713:122-1267(+)